MRCDTVSTGSSWGSWSLPLALYAVFVISPFVQAFYYSLTNWTGVSPQFDFIGLQNFQTLLHDSLFLRARAEQRGAAGGDAAAR